MATEAKSKGTIPRANRLRAVAKALERVKKRPLVVILVLIGTSSLGVIRWSNDIIVGGRALGEKLGILKAPDEKSEQQLAYQLGKAVAWRSFYITQNGSPIPKPGEPADIRASVTNNLAELRSFCKKLDLAIEPGEQDFDSSLLGDYPQSAAARYYVNSIAVKHRPEAAAAFRLGLAIEGTFWMAQRRKFEYSELSSRSAPQTLAVLNAQARALGAKPVSVVGLDTDEVVALNREMQSLVRDLDHNVSERL